jgi:hypothetical protein
VEFSEIATYRSVDALFKQEETSTCRSVVVHTFEAEEMMILTRRDSTNCGPSRTHVQLRRPTEKSAVARYLTRR